jgi:hypothetical protein
MASEDAAEKPLFVLLYQETKQKQLYQKLVATAEQMVH